MKHTCDHTKECMHNWPSYEMMDTPSAHASTKADSDSKVPCMTTRMSTADEGFAKSFRARADDQGSLSQRMEYIYMGSCLILCCPQLATYKEHKRRKMGKAN